MKNLTIFCGLIILLTGCMSTPVSTDRQPTGYGTALGMGLNAPGEEYEANKQRNQKCWYKISGVFDVNSTNIVLKKMTELGYFFDKNSPHLNLFFESAGGSGTSSGNVGSGSGQGSNFKEDLHVAKLKITLKGFNNYVYASTSAITNSNPLFSTNLEDASIKALSRLPSCKELL